MKVVCAGGQVRAVDLESMDVGLAAAPCCCTAFYWSSGGSRLRRQLADCLTACADCRPRGPLVHVWSTDLQLGLSTGVGLFVPKAERCVHNLRQYPVYLLIAVRWSPPTSR